MKETVKERAILQEKITEGRINGKNAMTQLVQPYMAPPKEGSPQLIILSIFSISAGLG